MSSRVRALELLNVHKTGDAASLSGTEADSLATHRAHPPHLSFEKDIGSEFVQLNFSDDLQVSRVYRRNQAFCNSENSLVTDSAYSLGWSFFSNLSMAEVSNISVINLAIVEGELFNPRRSSQTWSAQRNKGDPTDSHVHRQHTLPFKHAHKPVRATASAAGGPECRPASIQIQQQNSARDSSSVSISHPSANPEPVAQVNSSSGSPGPLMEQDNACHPCKGCREV